jgi:diguanylate cyclase (GGDEF)-like protein
MLDITDRMRAEEQVRTLAFQDSLTGLSNRARFFDLLGTVRSRVDSGCAQMAILFLDLDGFKEINDRHGHDIGDQLLRMVAERLRTTVRATDHLCRFGGDEFLVLIDPFNEEMQLEQLARQILATIAEPFEIDGRRMSVGVSIGIATYPRDAPNALALIRAADTAMYQAKQRGKGRYEFHRECAG